MTFTQWSSIARASVTEQPAERTVRVFHLLTAISQQAAEPKADLAEVLQFTANALHARLGYGYVAIYLVEGNSDDLALCAVAGAGAEQVPAEAYHARIGEGISGVAVRSSERVHVADYDLHPERTSELWPGQVMTELSLPIVDHGRTLGAVTVGADEADAFAVTHEEELAAVAEQLATAIRMAESRRRELDRATREALLTHLSHVINSSLSLRDVLSQAVSAIGASLKADRCTLGLINLAEQSFVTEHEYVNPMIYERRSLRRHDSLTGALAVAARSLHAGEVIALDTDAVNPVLGDYGQWLIHRYGIRSLVWVPIPSQSAETLYMLSLMQVTHARRWSEEDIQFLRGIADQLSLALRNARLFGDVQQAAAELKTKNAELEAFVYTVSHDLQAPVVSLRGFASLLQTRYQTALDERGQGYVARIGANADYLSRLLHDLLELSRVGRQEEPDEDIAVASVIEDVLADYGQNLTDRGVRLTLPKTWPMVKYSRLRLRQVFTNLLNNALKFLGPQPQPHIELGWRMLPHPVAPQIEFSVKDNGIGIHPDYHQRIFNLFERLKQVEVEGTGVGLSIVKRIIELRGGAIRVESAPGRGAAFYFTIPALAMTPQP
jgi:signal transduction histidine kinase/putative methionine-R-sulfoxide reductase with GAF domain